jgi:hypothetical protein
MRLFLNLGFMAIFIPLIGMSVQAQTQAKVDYEKIVGTWALEMDFGGNPFTLTLELKLQEGKLVGTMSDQMGILTNAPLSNVEFDGESFKADLKVPMPPDNTERLMKIEAKLAESKLEGAIQIVDFGMSTPFTGTKK